MNKGHYLFQRFAGWFSPYFSTKNNPLYHLADISIFMLAVATISGIYIFLFYNVDPAHSYQSVEKLSNQWVGGLMRSIHRYSSDLLVVFVLMHLVHMYITGKFRRILSWITGVGSFLVVIFLEIEVRLLTRWGGGSRPMARLANSLKVVLYTTLVVAAIYWGFKGDFLDFWDAALWLFAFVFIELNVFEWQQEIRDQTESAQGPV